MPGSRVLLLGLSGLEFGVGWAGPLGILVCKPRSLNCSLFVDQSWLRLQTHLCLMPTSYPLALLLPLPLLVVVVVQALFLWDRLGYPKIKADGTSEAEFVPGLSDLVGRGEGGGRKPTLAGLHLFWEVHCLHVWSKRQMMLFMHVWPAAAFYPPPLPIA